MADKTMVSSKMGDRTVKRLEKYAEKEGISRSQAVERMVKQGLDVEESDMRLIPVETDGGTKIENKLDSVQSSINSQNDRLDEQRASQKKLRQLNVGLAIAILWIGTVLIFSLPGWLVIGTGIAILALVGGLYFRTVR